MRRLDATKASLPEGTMVIIDDEYKIIDNLKLLEGEQKVIAPTQDVEE